MPRPPRPYRTTSISAYKQFKELYPEVKITYAQYKKILYTYNSMMVTHILETGDTIKLPYGMGILSINKKKQNTYFEKDGVKYCTLGKDWVKSKQLGKMVYFLNHHTDGYRYRFWWSSKNARFYQSDIWVFQPARIWSRTLAKYLKKPDAIYKDIYREHSRQ